MVVIEVLLSKAPVTSFRDTLHYAPWLEGKKTAMGMVAMVKQNG
jgi:predicted 2-oxoglutarate/Fe(II)-dependent dioxygenase YbiX